MPEPSPIVTQGSGGTPPWRSSHKARRLTSATAIELDGGVFRVAQIAPRGNRGVVTRLVVGNLDLPADATRTDPGVVGTALSKALEDVKLKPGPVVMGVPRHSVTLRSLSLPASDDLRELASMVHLQIGKDLPFRAEEAVIDFSVLEKPALPGSNGLAADEKSGEGASSPSSDLKKVEVLVAAVRRETVEYFQKLAQAANVKLVALGWSSQANARCVQACLQPEAGKAIALVSLRRDEVGLDVTAGGCLLFSRGAHIALTTDGEPASGPPANPEASAKESPAGADTNPAAFRSFTDAVLIETVRSLHAYSGTDGQPPITQVAIAGASGEENLVLDALGKRLNLPCRLLDPAAAMELPEEGKPSAPTCLGVIGLDLGITDPQGLPVDFLNPKRPAVHRDMRRIKMISLAAAGVALLIALLGVRKHLVNQHLKLNHQVQAELTAAEKKRPIYRQMQQQAASVQTWNKEGRNWLEQYAYLSAVLPGSEDLYITSLSVSGQGTVHLAVQARSGEIIANLDRQLRAAGYEVKPLAVTPGNDRYGYGFRSTVELLLPAKMTIDLAKLQIPARPADDGSLDPKGRGGRKGERR
jgi:Tfp pilus assembly PilM family ATPase